LEGEAGAVSGPSFHHARMSLDVLLTKVAEFSEVLVFVPILDNYDLVVLKILTI
jgi:hypothetical protein